ncbi:MAG: GpE family phage tail protein [Pseudomonadota bacterium]
MSRHFHWQPSEIDELPLEELLDAFERAKEYLKAEAEARSP